MCEERRGSPKKPIFGNVNLVSYQPGETDQFYHYYEYDADNRITDVYTARNPAINDLSTALKMTVGLPEFNPSMGWQKDAKYLYYLHGPLARVELGQNQVQGTDYTYTLHGWLKAINDGLMQNAHDPGLDGNATVGNANRWFGRDAAAIELGYYKSNAASTIEDYTAIGNNGHISGKTGSNFGQSTVSLYNGNIGSMVTTLPDKTQLSTNNVVQASSRGAVYQYDQLNRIRESWSFTNTDVPNYQWDNNLMPGAIPQEWLTQYTYDAMGNIETLRRQGGTGATDMDQLTYNYDYGTPTWKNQLLHVDDSKAAGLHTEDIDDQAANNYTYDEIGNLIADVAEEIQTIEWTVYGKIKKITRAGTSTKPNLEFEYNTAGQRVVKKVLPNNGDQPTITYYMRDASGNIMATYKHYYEIIDIPTSAAEERLAVQEFDIYGSSRLGTLNKEAIVASRIGVYTGGTFIPGDPDTYTIAAPLDFELSDEQTGYKNYELTNHLGNVLATITDRKVPFVNGSSYDYFNAQVVSMTDYYPFGMQIEERSWSISSYRFGFNGKEKDSEGMGGGLSTYDYGFRIYNPAIAKFLSVDPLIKGYPSLSPYQYASNTPIAAIDVDGMEGGLVLPRGWLLPRGIRVPIWEELVPPPLPILPTAPVMPRTLEENLSIPSAPSLPIPPNSIYDGMTHISGDINWADPPLSPEHLNDDWEEITAPNNSSGGINRTFKNKNTGEEIGFDKGQPGKGGFKEKDHWHRYNPDWNKKKGKLDFYLDRFGNPVNKGSDASHILTEGKIYMLPPTVVTPTSSIEYRIYELKMEQHQKAIEIYNLEMEIYREDLKEWIEDYKRLERINEFMEPKDDRRLIV